MVKQAACDRNAELEKEVFTLKPFKLEALQGRSPLLKKTRIGLLREQFQRIENVES